jgi:hypothetical protein
VDPPVSPAGVARHLGHKITNLLRLAWPAPGLTPTTRPPPICPAQKRAGRHDADQVFDRRSQRSSQLDQLPSFGLGQG